MRSAFDFAPFRRSTVGFDRLFDMLENSTFGQAGENYPPFDLIKAGDNEYRIELAVAGFKPEELDITAHENVLIVSGRKNEESEQKGADYVYRGIANRSFERRFALADHIKVTGASLDNGLLHVDLCDTAGTTSQGCRCRRFKGCDAETPRCRGQAKEWRVVQQQARFRDRHIHRQQGEPRSAFLAPRRDAIQVSDFDGERRRLFAAFGLFERH